jgi:hypothetical protein
MSHPSKSMKKHFALIVAINLCLLTQLTASSLEEKYLETRDQYIDRFQKSSGTNDKEDKQALNELEGMLKQIIGPIKIEGFEESGKINLETLDPDWDLGFGQLDGLEFSSKDGTVVVTTDVLMKKYLKNHKDLPKNYSELFKNGNFYSDVFVSDAAGTHYGEIPIKKENSFTYAALGGFGQDIGPFAPDSIFVFAVLGDKIFLVSSNTQTKLPQIPECEKEWNKYQKKASEAKDPNYNYEDLGFKAYCDCYSRLAKKQKFYESIVRQAQSIVARLPQ